jgi:hypothetical protein
MKGLLQNILLTTFKQTHKQVNYVKICGLHDSHYEECRPL